MLTVVAFACISGHGSSSWAFIKSSWASYGRDSQEETPSQNVPERRGSMTHSLHQAHWDHAHWGGSWFFCGCSSLPSSPWRCWRARDSGGPALPDLRMRAGCAQVGWYPILRSPKPTQLAGLACLPAPEVFVKRRASNAQFCKQPSQRKWMSFAKKVHEFLFTSEVFETAIMI